MSLRSFDWSDVHRLDTCMSTCHCGMDALLHKTRGSGPPPRHAFAGLRCRHSVHCRSESTPHANESCFPGLFDHGGQPFGCPDGASTVPHGSTLGLISRRQSFGSTVSTREPRSQQLSRTISRRRQRSPGELAAWANSRLFRQGRRLARFLKGAPYFGSIVRHPNVDGPCRPMRPCLHVASVF